MSPTSRPSDFSGSHGGDFSDTFSADAVSAGSWGSAPDFSMPDEDGTFSEVRDSGYAEPQHGDRTVPLGVAGPTGDLGGAVTAPLPRRKLWEGRKPWEGREPQQAVLAGGGAHPVTVRETTHVGTLVVLAGGLIAVVALSLAFLQISPIRTDPLGNSLFFLGLSLAGLALCGVGLVLAIRGALMGRPKHRPATAIVLALVVIPVMVLGAGGLGLNETKRAVQDSAISGAGNSLVYVLGLMADEGVNLGPLARFVE